jgi:hypothetical protein
LGYTFGRMYSPRTGQARPGRRPSKKSIKRTVEKVHELTVRAHTWQETTELVRAGGKVEPRASRIGKLLLSRHRQSGVSGARQLRGCAVASVVALQAQDHTEQGRQLSTPAPLRNLRARASDPAWARRAVGEGVKSCPRAQCGKSPAAFDERDVETELWPSH